MMIIVPMLNRYRAWLGVSRRTFQNFNHSSSEVEYFRHPTGAFSKHETIGQRRLGATIEREIANLLNLEATFKESLVERHGLAIHKVHSTCIGHARLVLTDC